MFVSISRGRQCAQPTLLLRTHRLLIPDKELIVGLVHGCKVIHGCDEHVDFDHVVKLASGCLQYGLEVLEGLSLQRASVLLLFAFLEMEELFPHRTILHSTLHWLECFRVQADVARAVDHSVVFDGLGELWEWLRGLICVDSFDLAHSGLVCAEPQGQ